MNIQVARTILFNAGFFTFVYGDNVLVAYGYTPVTIEQVQDALAPWGGAPNAHFNTFMGRVQLVFN